MQQAWLEALQWDVPLPSKQKEEWKSWFSDLSLLEEIKIPRCLKDKSTKESYITLHTLSASEKVYTAAVYTRHQYEDGNVTTRLIAFKTRLAPLKTVSIPRLELMGALIGLWLTTQVCSALKIPSSNITYWVDSLNFGFANRAVNTNRLLHTALARSMTNLTLTNGVMYRQIWIRLILAPEEWRHESWPRVQSGGTDPTSYNTLKLNGRTASSTNGHVKQWPSSNQRPDGTMRV